MCIWNKAKRQKEEKSAPVIHMEINSAKTESNKTVSSADISSELQAASKAQIPKLDQDATTVDSLDSEQLYDYPQEGNINIPKLDQDATTVDSLDSEQLYEKNVVKEGIRNEALLVQQWLYGVVGLAQYFDVFISNGFETLELIRAVDEIDDLNDIGITLPQHQTKIMQEINKLNAIYSPDEYQFPLQNYDKPKMQMFDSDESDDMYVEKSPSPKDVPVKETWSKNHKLHIQKPVGKTINYYDRRDTPPGTNK